MGAQISVLIPAFNEGDNLPEVVPEVVAVLEELTPSWEVLVVDDGSDDGTRSALARLRAGDDRIRSLSLRRNMGKSAALHVGFQRASGAVVVLMDADGQDDPAAIPGLIEALDGGLDLVTGRRAARRDRPVKRWTSRLYNWVTARVSGIPGRDFNSGLKAMRREVTAELELHGELHRYIPVLAHWAGHRVGEVDVVHRPRLHGRTKFGRARFWRGLLDLVTVKLLTTYDARPLHFFGGLALLVGSAGGALLGWMLVLRLTDHAIGGRPALFAGVLLVVVAVQLFSMGLLAELLVHLRRPRSPESLIREDG